MEEKQLILRRYGWSNSGMASHVSCVYVEQRTGAESFILLYPHTSRTCMACAAEPRALLETPIYSSSRQSKEQGYGTASLHCLVHWTAKP
jgi:hypothetical protein